MTRPAPYVRALWMTLIVVALHPVVTAGLRALQDGAPFDLGAVTRIALHGTPVFALIFGALQLAIAWLVARRHGGARR